MSSTEQTGSESELLRLRDRVARQQTELAILAEVAARVHDAEGVERILDVALDEILSGLDLQAAWVFVGHSRDRKLSLAASRGVSPSYLDRIRTEGLGECLCPKVFNTGQSMQAHNTTECPRMPTIVDGLTVPVAHACVPLRFEGRQLGVLNVAARPGKEFTEHELQFFETLGHQICIAVDRALHHAGEQARDREARALAAITRALGDSRALAPALDAVSETALELLGADRAVVFLGEDAGHLVVSHLAGLPHPALKLGQKVDLRTMGSSLQHTAIEEQRVLFVDDGRHEPSLDPGLAERWQIGAAVVAPLLAEKRTLGFLVITDTAPRHWPDDQKEVAITLAAQAAVAIEGARLYEDARRSYDGLKSAQAQMIRAEKMAVLGTFAAGLAHEIRNPLNSIALQLSIVDRRTARLKEELGDELRGLVRIIRDEVNRLDALVGDFLLFSRTKHLHHELVALDGLAEDVTTLMAPSAAAAGVRLSRQQLGTPIPSLPLDREKVKQVLINLVQNAIEATPGGEVAVTIGGLDGRAVLSVADNGPGLPEGVDVFQLFVTTKPQGTGLGLPIAQQIVLDHGGEIEVASEPGKGTVFTVSFPLPPGGS
jgi:signal transduction histidine kinase